jgi:hypothetical protein
VDDPPKFAANRSVFYLQIVIVIFIWYAAYGPLVFTCSIALLYMIVAGGWLLWKALSRALNPIPKKTPVLALDSVNTVRNLKARLTGFFALIPVYVPFYYCWLGAPVLLSQLAIVNTTVAARCVPGFDCFYIESGTSACNRFQDPKQHCIAATAAECSGMAPLTNPNVKSLHCFALYEPRTASRWLDALGTVGGTITSMYFAGIVLWYLLTPPVVLAGSEDAETFFEKKWVHRVAQVLRIIVTAGLVYSGSLVFGSAQDNFGAPVSEFYILWANGVML